MIDFKKSVVAILIIILTLIFLSYIINNQDINDDDLIQIFYEDHQNSNANLNSTIFDMIRKVNESTLENHLKKIQEFGSHPTGSESLESLGKYIYNCFDDIDLSVKYHDWRYKLRRGRNIEATLPGIGSTDGIVILCAHYDSTAISPGLDDDGSGLAAILTIAEILKDYEFNSTIKFVMFSGEEQGLLGSHEYAKDTYNAKDHILGVICLDGIGYAKTRKEGYTIRNYADEHSDWIYEISKNITIKYNDYVNLDIERHSNVGISDHQSFYEKGYATSYFFEYKLDPFYHTTEDTIDKMNMSYLTKVSRLTLGTIVGMAKLNREIYNEDINIQIKGSILSYPENLVVRIENKKHTVDTANLYVQIEIKNFFNDVYVKGPYNSVSNWNFTKEINEYWDFLIGSHSFPKFELIRVYVTVKGFNDDTGLYYKESTIGFVRKSFIRIIPKF